MEPPLMVGDVVEVVNDVWVIDLSLDRSQNPVNCKGSKGIVVGGDSSVGYKVTVPDVNQDVWFSLPDIVLLARYSL